MNQAQLKKLVASFAKMADKEGRVSKAVFRKTIEEYYGGSDGTLLRMIMTLFDKDNSSDIDFREFTLALSYATNSELSDAIDLAFQCFDLNGDGGISRGIVSIIINPFTLHKIKLTIILHVCRGITCRLSNEY